MKSYQKRYLTPFLNTQNMNTIKPRTLKGFRDFWGEELLNRKQVFKVFELIFQKYGYEPLETPALEYFDILMGKYGEEEKLVYNFEDFGGRRVALKYDLTVPTSRVLAQYSDKLILPWKRYQMQPVWRADNTQKGRFREFYQCDADILGSPDMLADAEFITMGIEIIKTLGFKQFKVRLNNRKILNAIAEYSGREDKFEDIVYAIDKWEKRSEEDTMKDLQNRGLSEAECEKVISCIKLGETDSLKALAKLEMILEKTKEGKDGVNELIDIINLVKEPELVIYDPTIARGLSYYTGPVWEWNITEGGVGSIGGCGRYDKLIGSFLGRDIPATGGSFGVERILEVMKDRGMLTSKKLFAKVLVTVFDKTTAGKSIELCDYLRKNDISSFVYPQYKSIGKQLDYASKKGISFAVIIGPDEIKNDSYTIKDMSKGEQKTLDKKGLLDVILN